ncbi:VOC family protein [Amycolatopsis sp. cmx-4-68]|uniref:VOC family protein n=1 Tax=Amycolatopsis sp. cmx-4-68 TaxID=2790938 RepID=UPI00397BD3DC
MADRVPRLRQVVLDAPDAPALAEFYRRLLGFSRRPGDGSDWVVLLDAAGTPRLAFQQVPSLPPPTWPDGPRPQMLHLDLTVETRAELDEQHERAISLGARLLTDQADDPAEPLRVYADPAGHPFCLFVGSPG